MAADLRPWRRWLLLGGALLLLALVGAAVVGLADDEADRAYYAFLRSDEDGSTDAQRQAHIDRAIELAPDRARYFESRAGLRTDRRDIAGALSDLDRAIALEDRPYLRYRRALALSQLGDYGRALADYDLAIGAQPHNTQFYRGRALARIAVGHATDALADGARMVADAPQWGESYFARGSALAALGRDAVAVADFDEALRIRPELVYVWRAREASCERLGDADGVRNSRAAVARLAPHSHARELDPFRY